MHLNRSAALLAGLTLVLSNFALFGAVPAKAETQRSVSEVRLFETPIVVPGAWSSLVRHDHGVSMTMHTTALPAGSVDTVWWLVFNQPQNCRHGRFGLRCGPQDLFASPSAEPSVLYATGAVVGPDGAGQFDGHLKVGDTSGCVPMAVPPHFPCGNGLVNPMGADIHLVIRTHGAPIPGLVDEQLGTFDGGCTINACANVQASPHGAAG